MARLARAGGLPDWIKLEVIPDPRYLLPDPVETLKAAEALVAEGFTVLALMATLAGEPLYNAYGFRATERLTFTAPDGVAHEAVAMERPIDPA